MRGRSVASRAGRGWLHQGGLHGGEREESAEAVVRVTTLDAGAPVDVLLNGKVLAEDLAISGSGWPANPRPLC